MPWDVKQIADEWCVVKEGESKPVGCHASRSQALKQQAALYAQERSTASAGNGVQAPGLAFYAPTSELDAALVSSVQDVSEQMAKMNERVENHQEVLERIVGVLAALDERTETDRQQLHAALTAALERPDPPVPDPPIVNVTVPEPVVTVNVPEAIVQVTTPTPNVNVTIPPAKREIKFTRDPMTNQISGADVMEVDGGE